MHPTLCFAAGFSNSNFAILEWSTTEIVDMSFVNESIGLSMICT